jgi:hypothetical protein
MQLIFTLCTFTLLSLYLLIIWHFNLIFTWSYELQHTALYCFSPKHTYFCWLYLTLIFSYWHFIDTTWVASKAPTTPWRWLPFAETWLGNLEYINKIHWFFGAFCWSFTRNVVCSFGGRNWILVFAWVMIELYWLTTTGFSPRGPGYGLRVSHVRFLEDEVWCCGTYFRCLESPCHHYLTSAACLY